MSHGVPSYNRLEVTRTTVPNRRGMPLRRVRLDVQRRNSWGRVEDLQVTFAEQTVVRALRRAGFMVVTPEEMKG